MQIWHNLLKPDFASSHFQCCLETHKLLSPKIKWSIKWRRSIARSMLNEQNYVYFSLFDSMFMHINIFSLKVFLVKSCFYSWGIMNICVSKYTHYLGKTIVHGLMDSKKKKKDKIGLSPHMPKLNPMSSSWAYN